MEGLNKEYQVEETGVEKRAPYICQFCGMPSWYAPSEQTPPPDYCHEIDHGSPDDD